MFAADALAVWKYAKTRVSNSHQSLEDTASVEVAVIRKDGTNAPLAGGGLTTGVPNAAFPAFCYGEGEPKIIPILALAPKGTAPADPVLARPTSQLVNFHLSSPNIGKAKIMINLRVYDRPSTDYRRHHHCHAGDDVRTQ